MIILDDVVPAAPPGLRLAVAAWAQAVAGGAACAPLALRLLPAAADGVARGAARLHGFGLALAGGAAAASLLALGRLDRVAANLWMLQPAAPLVAGLLASLALALVALAGLAAARRPRAAPAVAAVAALAGVFCALAPGAHLAMLPSRDLFTQGAAFGQQALTGALALTALLRGVAGGATPQGDRLRRAQIVILATTLVVMLVEELPAAGTQALLLEKARHAMTARTLAPLTLGVALGAGTLLPLVLAVRGARPALPGVLALIGRLAFTIAFVRAGLSLGGA